MTPNPAYIAAVQDSVRTAAYPSLLGMTLDELGFESCLVGLTLAERHLQPFGIVHGGVLATLIDTATCRTTPAWSMSTSSSTTSRP